jgi:hypothetical protein
MLFIFPSTKFEPATFIKQHNQRQFHVFLFCSQLLQNVPSNETMPPVLSKLLKIDLEWSNSLVGLPMDVPEHWWDGCAGNSISVGEIARIDQSAKFGNIFLLKLEEEDKDDDNNLYAMCYDAVLCYTNSESHKFSKYNLPAKPPSQPSQNENVHICRGCRSTRTSQADWAPLSLANPDADVCEWNATMSNALSDEEEDKT